MSNYWIPEDVQAQWANLLPQFEMRAKAYAGQQILLGVQVRNGDVAGLVEVRAERLEPNGRVQGAGNQWWSVIRRIQSIGSNLTGEAIILTKVVLNAQGQPVCWTTPEIMRLEPKKQS